ncbi:protein SOSEKI 2 [Typha angustifolia]|uniref:protein SOSEKI 2 n=1 Tax=Typha angustifolia TaxID=59011 RepID=UPI003C2BF2B8
MVVSVVEMEANGGRRRLSSRETSPDRVRAGYHHQQQQQKFTRPLRKVQVVYYLSRNGQLEHPHFMELPHLPNQHLRLKDVMDRLTLLRGKGMPALFSWSCKRSYKNGYVWNDLSENDVIYPSDGAEYVLKGSEIIAGCSERFQHLRVSKTLSATHKQYAEADDEEEMEEVDEHDTIEEEQDDNGSNYTANNGTSRSPLSRGASMEGIERVKNPGKARANHHRPMELSMEEDASPPSSSSSDKPTAATAPILRFEDGDSVGEPGSTRNSVLLQFITCGSGAVKGRPATAVGSPLGGGRKSGGLHRGVVSRFASRALEEDELRGVAENPRFRHLPVEDKEYFSGSIVEGSRGPPEPSLKKSNSYNEERSSRLAIGEGMVESEEERVGVRGKCIPGRKKSSGKLQQQQQQQQPKK